MSSAYGNGLAAASSGGSVASTPFQYTLSRPVPATVGVIDPRTYCPSLTPVIFAEGPPTVSAVVVVWCVA